MVGMERKDRLSRDQRKALSQFAGTLAAAWFTAGFIAPVFTKLSSLNEIYPSMIFGIMMTSLSLWLSLSFVGR